MSNKFQQREALSSSGDDDFIDGAAYDGESSEDEDYVAKVDLAPKARAAPRPKRTPKPRKLDAKPKKRKRDPTKPKGPISAYFWFLKDKRADIIAENPELKSNAPAVAKKAGSIWRSMDEADKKQYQAQAAEDKERHRLAMEKWREEKDAEESPAKKAKMTPVE
mmetsp:Transcript_3374/g.3715  ORF Transcript_3374/g.3715 Transcript_3374/m.3715 type:complete len:164 (-) Transcript_3374:213-704(-)|eukprot:CAMPEP_0168513748 /NCGR_PEP_ID=MMETSP0405-20121227/3670_1 /TAXON_ID=498012 /ORGANISM="Trichosphaerium sp, Strain Am-I-7 wt" /LENGTH=163 /DNA_ID=CAMNT_0008532685 /DNA_START=133 /DNA_END=624 /DNA_ORIENTATION=+